MYSVKRFLTLGFSPIIPPWVTEYQHKIFSNSNSPRNLQIRVNLELIHIAQSRLGTVPHSTESTRKKFNLISHCGTWHGAVDEIFLKTPRYAAYREVALLRYATERGLEMLRYVALHRVDYPNLWHW
jgi:hypothetical protein